MSEDEITHEALQAAGWSRIPDGGFQIDVGTKDFPQKVGVVEFIALEGWLATLGSSHGFFVVQRSFETMSQLTALVKALKGE